MTNKKTGFVLGGIAALQTASTVAQEAAESFKEYFQQELKEKLPGISTGDRNAQQEFQQLCFSVGTPDREPDRAIACEIIAEALDGELEKSARLWLITQCQHIGREECVDAVAKSLDDKDVHIRDAARRALIDNPAQAANECLIAKLATSDGVLQVGLINGLGYRADPGSVDPLAALLESKDTAAATAAANALGKIANEQAAKALKTSLPKAGDVVKAEVADAYLRCAEQLLQAGKRNEAISIYTELSKLDVPKTIRLAAIRGKLEAVKGN